MDKDGNLWVAVFSASKVIKIDSSKPETLLDVIVLPVPQVILISSLILLEFETSTERVVVLFFVEIKN